MKEDKKNLIVELTFNFALKIIEYAEILENNRKYSMANQLIRCGTSIGSNVRGAQSAESKADFVHKLKIADKESEETDYRLQLCNRSKNYPPCSDLVEDLGHVKRVLGKIISSSKK